MKRVFLAGVALAALMGSASAADIPRRVVERPAAAPVPYVAAYNWTGFYVGLNAGWGWGADCEWRRRAWLAARSATTGK